MILNRRFLQGVIKIVEHGLQFHLAVDDDDCQHDEGEHNTAVALQLRLAIFK